MRVLLINKFHSRKDGAARAYFDTAEVLESHGHEVAFFAMRGEHDEPTPWSAYFVDPVDYHATHSIAEKWQMVKDIWWNRKAQKKLNALLDEFNPDVAHLHVIYHQLSPSIIAVLKKRGIPVVMTLHDYKLICPNYSMYVRGHIWEGGGARCIADRCVKDSVFKSVVCAIERWLHRAIGIYERVDAYMAPSAFLIEKFREHRFRKEIHYIPQPLFPKDRAGEEMGYFSRGSLLYVGSLAVHKGVDVLLRALAELPGERLRIAGDGPERDGLQALAIRLNVQDRVTFLGHLSREAVRDEMQSAKIFVLPSVWFENMPYVLLEALAHGKIVVASKMGGITERIVDNVNGFLFKSGNNQDLARVIRNIALREDSDLLVIQKSARKSVDDLSPEAYCQKLLVLYEDIIHRK